jgi:hypothetical protein
VAAVVDMDVGKRDLMHCADAIMRLRAEYLYRHRRQGAIRFRYSGGPWVRWSQWMRGWRPRRRGKGWSLRKVGGFDASYANLRRYLRSLYIWGGTYSLYRYPRVRTLAEVRSGQFFVQGGSPGHAVLIVDVARDRHGRVKVLLAQSFMPAQDVHVLRPKGRRTPWFDLVQGGHVGTPFWPLFYWKDLRRFR